jgi:hypothetical protein
MWAQAGRKRRFWAPLAECADPSQSGGDSGGFWGVARVASARPSGAKLTPASDLVFSPRRPPTKREAPRAARQRGTKQTARVPSHATCSKQQIQAAECETRRPQLEREGNQRTAGRRALGCLSLSHQRAQRASCRNPSGSLARSGPHRGTGRVHARSRPRVDPAAFAHCGHGRELQRLLGLPV